MKNSNGPIFRTDLIRAAIRKTPIHITVEDARKLLQNVKERIRFGEKHCFICSSAAYIFGHYSAKKESIRNFMGENKIYTLEDMSCKWISNFDRDRDEYADPLRVEFLRILIDMKRNRNGKTK